jgi:molybdate transport system ATP-binding protein
VAGLERAPLGRVIVGGEVWQDDGRWLPVHKRPLGYVFQEASLFEHLTVMGNLCYGMKRTSESQGFSLEKAINLLGIESLLQRKPEGLSGGERQRVAIARALAVNPRLLLMDEPLAALDFRRKKEIIPYLERLHTELEIPVLYVTHSTDEAARIADHLVVMDEGQVLASGPLASALTRMDLPWSLDHGDGPGVVLEATVGHRDSQWSLLRADFAGGSLWAPDPGLAEGRRIRIRILARDVSLAQSPGETTIQNILAGIVDEVGSDTHPGMVMVRIAVGSTFFLAKVSRKAAHDLSIVAGRQLWVQVKSATLID